LFVSIHARSPAIDRSAKSKYSGNARPIAQWALPFTPRVPQMSVRKIKS
jgi:hypothetical protein